MAVFQLYAEGGVGQGVDDLAFHFNNVFFGHDIALLVESPGSIYLGVGLSRWGERLK
jgi:hypothetical protein